MTVNDYNSCVNQHADAVYRFILKNIRDKEKARDLVQDSFEKLWMNVDQVAAGKAKSYLFTTAYHKMIDQTRQDKRMAAWDDAHTMSWSHSEHYSDAMEKLNQGVTRLPSDQRSVLMLRDYEGYSYKEIAEITGLTEAQVKVYIYRARVFLKEYIGSIEVLV
ncbi:MAG: RNA polymerase subunit sigma-24 [Bacteroidetes bacterium GWF2_49_14]|nr:MAG: RNA polymerase subunit sigma-24 [Bacteroidetes bacterium GWF2_49_14]HBB93411.1 RNA polymerase sigma factor [Bacteroidales bacterium]